MKEKKNCIYYIILSITAEILLLTVVFLNYSSTTSIDLSDKLFIGGLFIGSCLFGISIAQYPGWYKRLIHQQKHNLNNQQKNKTTRRRKGHHPDCKHFFYHTIKTQKKIFCAGCFGLSLGSILSISVMVLYIIIENNMSSTLFYLFLYLGIIIIDLIFIETFLSIKNTTVHVISNVLLVISFLLICISILEITGNPLYVAISILFSILWLDTRIHLSNWRHTLVCKNCVENCKMY